MSDPSPARPNGPLEPPGLDPGNTPPTSVGQLGPYQVLAELGRGEMGVVYLALDTRLGSKVAVKLMRPEHFADPRSRAAFLREARALAMVSSEHVVSVFSADEVSGVPFITMEHLQGYPLDGYLRAKGELPLPQALRVAREAALGLAATHAAGLIHCDIKLNNIFLEAPNGRVKLLDFGNARVAEQTGPGAVTGTSAYVSPEQTRGLTVDRRTDLFGLGVVLYRLCTGKMPFVGNSEEAVMVSAATDAPVAPRRLNPRLPQSAEVIITKLLAKNPDERFQTAQEVAGALKESLDTLLSQDVPPLSPVPTDAPTRKAPRRAAGSHPTAATPPARKRPKWPLVLAVGALLAAGAIAAVALWPK